MRRHLTFNFMSYTRVVWLGDVDKGRNNNLNVIRFLMASSVILSHSWISLGLLGSEPIHERLKFTDLGTISVYGFFFISGYLILKSALRSASPIDYFVSRFLRIFPGLALVVVLCGVIVAPIMTSVSLRNYFSSPLTAAFFSEIWMHHMQHILPGVCTNYPLPWINASLWTLPGEWLMYVLTMVTCLAFRWRSLGRTKLSVWLFLLAVLLFTAQMLPLQWVFAFQWFRCFAIGSACYLMRDRVPLWIPGAFLLFAIDLFFVWQHIRGGTTLFSFALCYFLVTMGYHPAVYLRRISNFGDYSYGLYIYGQPIQQALLSHFHRPIPFFIACYPIVLFVAVLSWHYVEQPALSLKHRFIKDSQDAESGPLRIATTRGL